MKRQKRKLTQRIRHKIESWLGIYKLHYKIIKGGCPRCHGDLKTCEVAVKCLKCDYEIVAG